MRSVRFAVGPLFGLFLIMIVACRPSPEGSGTVSTSASTTDSTQMRLSGTIKSVNIEGGCWRFDASDGKHYEILRTSAPAGLLEDGRKATLTLKLRPDQMSTCMVGPIVEVVRVE